MSCQHVVKSSSPLKAHLQHVHLPGYEARSRFPWADKFPGFPLCTVCLHARHTISSTWIFGFIGCDQTRAKVNKSMRRDKQRPAPQSLTVLFEGSFLRLQFSDIIPWAELLQLDCYWALVQLRSCKSQPRQNRGQSRTGHLLWTPLTSCVLFPVYESLTRTFYLF